MNHKSTHCSIYQHNNHAGEFWLDAISSLYFTFQSANSAFTCIPFTSLTVYLDFLHQCCITPHTPVIRPVQWTPFTVTAALCAVSRGALTSYAIKTSEESQRLLKLCIMILWLQLSFHMAEGWTCIQVCIYLYIYIYSCRQCHRWISIQVMESLS